jgi:hypothetical protein
MSDDHLLLLLIGIAIVVMAIIFLALIMAPEPHFCL